MSSPVNRFILFEASTVLLLTVGIFVLDCMTPLGWGVWLLYLVPLTFMLQASSARDPYYYAAVATILTLVGWRVSPPGGQDPIEALINRLMGIGVMWIFTWMMVRQKQARAKLAGVEAARSQAETLREAAVKARELAEASLTGAVHRESQAMRELLLSSLRLEGIMQSAMDAILTVDEQQRVVLFNEAAERMFGCSAKDALGQPLDRFIPPRFRDAHRQHIEKFGRSGVTNRKMGALGTVSGVKADGEEFPVEASISQISVEGKKFYTVILRDLTERKRMEEQLRRTERIAELGTLASGMAHEIGTPMNVILGRAEYLMQRTQEEPLKKGLQTIISQVERITRVMNQLLAFARRKPVERRALDLQKTVEDNLEIFEERLGRHRIIVERSFEGSCPPVFADADQMSQVVINLVMNALHAMPDGGTLRVGVLPNDGMVRLTVADTGHGIPQDVVDKIFDPFFTTKEFGKGTGLGLTVVKGIIEEHQGTIAVESDSGKGTTFTIHLPVHQANS
jgi:PAS domain S-box-containing protein